jgi:hypothetical protein
MANSEFNLDMDNYLRKIRKKRTDPVDYSNGSAKVSSSSTNINNLPDDEIIIEEKQEGGFKKFLISLFKRNKTTDVMELEEQYEEDVPIETAIAEEDFEEDFDEIERQTESSLMRFFSRLFPRKLASEDIDEELIEAQLYGDTSNVIEDTKKTFQSLNKWLEKLPAKEKAEFKNSEDFIVYREFLKKYKLIKE